MEDQIFKIIGLFLTATSIIVAFISVFIGAKIAYKRAKTIFTLDLHKEISSEEMMRHRMNAQSILAKHYPKTLNSLINEIPDELHSVWVITGFYERLYLAMYHKQLNDKLIIPLFCRLFYFFHFGFFKKQLQTWDLSEYMKGLENEFEMRLKDKNKNNIWKDEAKNEAKSVIKYYRSDSFNDNTDQ